MTFLWLEIYFLMNFAILLLFNSQVLAIIPPVWTELWTLSQYNRSFGEKVLNDINGNCYVLSTYSHAITIGNVINRCISRSVF